MPHPNMTRRLKNVFPDRQKLPLPWWLRAPFVGAWLNFVLTLFAYDLIGDTMIVLFGQGGALQSPWWFVLEGAIVGAIIGYLATRFGGEGPESVKEPN